MKMISKYPNFYSMLPTNIFSHHHNSCWHTNNLSFHNSSLSTSIGNTKIDYFRSDINIGSTNVHPQL